MTTLTLSDVRQITTLEKYTLSEVLEIFAQATNEEGFVPEAQFFYCFEELIGDDISPSDKQRLPSILHTLYRVFDTNHDNVVDFTELGTGLACLCGGSHEDKVKAAFDLYDYNGDGVISLDEMKRYLTAVFKVVYALDPKLATDGSPEELAEHTAEHCFEEGDLNHDGRLTYSEFKRWYNGSDGNAFQALGRVAERAISLDDVRRITGLEQYSINDVLEVFAGKTDAEGYVSESSFFHCFEGLIGDDISDDDKEILPVVLGKLYDIFDSNNDGVVDFTELGTGLTPLVGGSKDEKAKAAFDLYDYNGDGVISL